MGQASNNTHTITNTWAAPASGRVHTTYEKRFEAVSNSCTGFVTPIGQASTALQSTEQAIGKR